MIKWRYILFVILSVMLLDLYILPQASVAEKKMQDKEHQHVQKQEDDRSKLRAFYTAPPVIPHEVTFPRGNKECLYCHKEVLQVQNRVSVKTPHTEFSNCQQCHVQGNIENPIKVGTSWSGLKEPKKETRAHEFAPPTIPHRIALRENCLSCHGPKNPDEKLRTSHPERTNCMQCHVQMEGREFNVMKKYGRGNPARTEIFK